MNWKVLDNDVGGYSAYIPKEKNSAIGAAALGAGISVLGSLLSSSAQNSANASMDRETREWQEKMWSRNNEYNTPLNQRKRLEAAGINPALAFQNGNTGVASSTPSAVQHTPADYSSIGAGFSQAGQMILQAQNVAAQNELLKSQAEAQKIDNASLHLRRLAEWEKLKAEQKKLGADSSWIDWQEKRDMAMFDAIQKKNYSEIQNLESQTLLNNVQARLGMDTNSREWQKLAPTLRQLESIANSNNSAALLNKRNANIIPRLSDAQLEQISNAYVDEKLKNASAEEIAGFKFSGTTIQEMKSAVKNWLKGAMFGN